MSNNNIVQIGSSFWEEKHARSDSDWLTGTDIQKLMKYYDITFNDLDDKVILEIGVGLGHCARAFKARAKKLFCCDISQTALDHVKEYADQLFLSKDLKNSPPVDIAIAHLVLLHCDDEETLRIINDVNLNEEGKFLFQFSGLQNDQVLPRVKADLIDKGTHFFRNGKQMQEIINKSNKELVNMTVPAYAGEFHGNWLNHEYYFAVVKNKKGI
jgi:SAM-dependent methyltransferase